jgi:sulfur carrier protein
MKITVNGEPRQVEPDATLASLADSPSGIAIAVNGEVVRAADWAATQLRDQDAVEIVTAHQGG